MTLKGSVHEKLGQLELNIQRVREVDRNYHKGGRSFYFFDFDDNVVTLQTPIVLFKKQRNASAPGEDEVHLSSAYFARHSRHIGQMGPFVDYEVRLDDSSGSFRYFRDEHISDLERAAGKKQGFIRDFSEILQLPDHTWKGPSWSCFYHAVFNSRPISVITARGHHPETIKKGIDLLVERGSIPHAPNYLSLYPVNHPETRKALGHGVEDSVPVLKKSAIRSSVEKAIEVYGESPFHRFGMSDDDPSNIELIIEEMVALKKDYPELSFFVIDTHEGRFIKKEVFVDHIESFICESVNQLSLL